MSFDLVPAGTPATPDEWAARIRGHLSKSVEGFVAAGKSLAEAKASLPHGAWLPVLEQVGINKRTAERLMAIGRHPVLANTTHVSHLPPSWGTLYELARADEDTLAEAIAEGRVHPDMERKEAVALVAGNGYDPMDGDEWYTPGWLFDALGIEFDLDVCAPFDLTHVTTPAKRHLNADDDGLRTEWHGTVWCNPPYSTPAPWAEKMIEHGNGLLLVHMPMNAGWCVDVWHKCDGIRLFQAIEFVRPDGAAQRPGYWLQLAAFGNVAASALAQMTPPDHVRENPRRVPSPMWRSVA